jgi:hypothetical protein
MTSDDGKDVSAGRELGQEFSTAVNGNAFLKPRRDLRAFLGDGARPDHAIRIARGYGLAQNLDPFAQKTGTEGLGKAIVIGFDLNARPLEI